MPKPCSVLSVLCASFLGGALLGQGGSTFTLSFEGSPYFCGTAGSVQTQEYLCVLSSSGPGPGAQAWSIAVRAANASIKSITTSDTDTLDFLGLNSFQVNRLTGGAGNEGAVSVVVLSETELAVLPPGGTQRIARIRVEAALPAACGKAELSYVDSLVSLGQPVRTTITESGLSVNPRRVSKPIDFIIPGQDCLGLNPAGWIQASGWNLCFPLTNPYGCDGGGPENMLRNWVAPRDLGVARPRPGARWGDVDFQGAAAATGFGMANVYAAVEPGADPVRWADLEMLAALPGADPQGIAPPDAERVDFQAIVSAVNGQVVPGLPGFVPWVLSDNVLGIAQTHLKNVTAQPVCVNVLTRSEDSIQVWVNDRLVTNRSRCGALLPDSEARDPAVLEPGTSTITVLCWDGEGDWGFGLSLEDETGAKLGGLSQSELLFLGSSPPPAPESASSAPAVARASAAPDACPVPNPTAVTLKGNGEGSGPVVVEEVYPRREVAGILEVSHSGRIEAAPDSFIITWNVSASELNATGVSYKVDLAPGAVAHPRGTIGGCAAVAGEREVRGSWPHTGPIGAFGDSHDIGSREALAAGAGSLALNAGPDGQPGSADDTYTIRGSGEDLGDLGDSFHFAYLRFRGDFSATVRIKSRSFPLSGGRRSRYGLMAREDCAPNSKYSFLHANLEADPGPGADHLRGDAVFWQFRRNHRLDGSTDSAQSLVFPDPDGGGAELANQPNHFRLNRRGRTFTGYASFDGATWKLVGSDTWYALEADGEVLVGFAHSKHSSASQPGEIAFGEFEIGPLPAAEVFDDDGGGAERTIYRSGFEDTPKGALPPGLAANCRPNCTGPGGFAPRVVGGRLRLSQEGVQENATSVFLKGLPIPASSGKLIVEFTAFLSHSGVTRQPPAGDPNPGDGLTLAILAGRAGSRVGSAGGGLGFEGIARGSFADAAPSFAVEIDTRNALFHNEGAGSPTADGSWHLGINAGGNVHSLRAVDSGLPDIFAPEGVRFRVELTSEGRISVFLPAAGGGGQGGEAPLLEGQGEPLSSQGDPELEVGFTAGTGLFTETAEVDDVGVSVVECSDAGETASISGPASARPGELVALDASGSSPGPGDGDERPFLVYRWSIISGGELAALRTSAEPSRIEVEVFRTIEDGEVVVGVTVDDGRCRVPPSATRTHTLQVKASNWMSYDANGDGKVDISDPTFDFGFQFLGGRPPACLEAMDFNQDGKLDITDPISALSFLFLGGPPAAKGAGCRAYPTCGSGCGCGEDC